jgi:hypothetical protein
LRYIIIIIIIIIILFFFFFFKPRIIKITSSALQTSDAFGLTPSFYYALRTDMKASTSGMQTFFKNLAQASKF